MSKAPLWRYDEKLCGNIWKCHCLYANRENRRNPHGKYSKLERHQICLSKGASTDFPAASIIIGNKVYYTHWSPTKAHISHLQISSSSAIDAEIREAENALNSDCEIFIGGHGNVSNRECVIFKINYLKTLKSLLSKDKKTFIETLKKYIPTYRERQALLTWRIPYTNNLNVKGLAGSIKPLT